MAVATLVPLLAAPLNHRRNPHDGMPLVPWRQSGRMADRCFPGPGRRRMSEQPISSLDRYRKRSARLVLEEHGSSVVPAGCGGVVLRWRNPQQTVPLVVYLYSPGQAQLFLDGALVESTGVDLA